MSTEQRIDTKRLASEFVVIFLGVLVALAVEQWWEYRQDRSLEQEYYASLVEDMKIDIDEYELSINVGNRSISLSRELLGVIISSDDVETSRPLNEVLYYSSFVNYPERSTGTFDELMSSGNIRLLLDAEIKSALFAYYRTINEWKPRLRGEEFGRTFIQSREITGDLRFHITIGSGDQFIGNDELAQKLRQRQELAPIINKAASDEEFRVSHYEQQREQALALIGVIEQRFN
jgi:hypothetical protein